jgi:Ni2+-binding GTPase involved in maturation of urease and hydrogenase
MPTADSTTSPPIRFVMLGGFLGAGKTTTIARLAQHYQSQGRNVAIVTNDKAADSVDTLRLRAQGLHVGELPGACFCGNVDELIDMVDALGAAARPDVVLAEPVGSCLDMVGTVIRPLEQSYGRRFEVAPYGVLVKPTHAARILRGDDNNVGVSPQAAYIFRQQLAEADFAAINRCDQLSPAEVDELQRLLVARHPNTPVLTISARTGQGCETLTDLLEQRGEFGRRIVQIDYDAYSTGEAQLGWLNATLLIEAAAPLEIDRFLLELLRGVRDEVRSVRAETAHVKLIALGGGRHAAANLISNAAEPETTTAAGCSLDRFQLVVNARVACDPASLRRVFETQWTRLAAAKSAQITVAQLQCFSPGGPTATSRFGE